MKPQCTLVVVLAAALLPALCAQTAPVSTTAPTDETLTLNVFSVTSSRDTGYRKLSSVTTSRIGVSLYEAPQAIEIISGELLSDMNIAAIRHVFDYTSSVTKNQEEVFQGGSYKLRGFELPQYINGVSLAQNSSGPGYVSSDNVDRIELAKGPVGLFYGNSSPNGVANTVTKRPQYTKRTDLEVSGGNFQHQKALLDTQDVVSEKYGIAYRLIASASKSMSRLDKEKSYDLFAGSVSVKPSKWIQFQGEFDVTHYKEPYAAVSAWNYMFNPLYYQQVANPDQTMLNYVKGKYAAADDAAARAVISSRWGINAPKANLSYITVNWIADYFGAYGQIAYPFVGTSVQWDRYSPEGDKFTTATPDSRLDGTNRLSDASLTLTPFEHTSIQYHWVHNENIQNFDRGLAIANPGPLDANGRVPSLGFSAMQLQLRQGYTDTQQVDISQELKLGDIRHRFIGGVEARRSVSFNGSATLDLTKGPTQQVPGGGTTTGLASIQSFLPFSQPYPKLLPLVVSGITQVESNPTKYQDWYASYRGSAFNNKLNVMAGVRNVKQKTTNITSTGQSELTKSAGVIGEIHPGLYAFASYSTTFQFSSGYTVTYLANGLPVPGEGAPLSPEKGKGYEIGFKSALFNDKVSGTLSYFQVQRDGVVTADIARNVGDPRNTDADLNNDVRFNLNGGLQRSKGFDGDLVWTPTSALQFLANFTYTMEAKILSDPSVNTANINISETNARTYDKEFRHRLSKSPKFSSNLVGKYNFTEGSFKGLFVGAGVRYTGRFSVTDSPLYDTYVNAETLIDTFAGYRTKIAAVPATLQLNLQNITNKYNDITRDDGFVVQARVSLHF